MSKSMGSLIRKARQRKGLSREQLAVKLRITGGYVGHLERDDDVRMSERVADQLRKAIGLRLPDEMVHRHNVRALRNTRAYQARWRKKNSKKSA